MDIHQRDRDPSELSAHEVDAALRALARHRSGTDYRIGRLLLRADSLSLFRVHGYASLREYCERVFGFGARATEDRLRVARALDDLPRLNEAAARGEIVFAILRELCRVATAETEAEWIEATEGKTSREVQRMVAGRFLGERPSDPQDPDLVPRRLSFEVGTEVYALVLEARQRMTKEKGARVDDAKFLSELVLSYFGAGTSERDPGRAPYQIAMMVDAEGRARMKAGSESVAVSRVTLDRARCDAENLGVIDASGDAPRAAQTIPPRTRRQVMQRHGGCCAIPGCRNSAFVEVHHIVPRSEGGRHDPEQLIVLCGGHHDATHRGALEIAGRYSTGFTFWHADGRPYGSSEVSTVGSRTFADAFDALRSMGWKDKEARTMLDAVRTRVRENATVSEVVAFALKAAPTDWAMRSGAWSGVREEVGAYLSRVTHAA